MASESVTSSTGEHADVVKLTFRDDEFEMTFYEPFRMVFVGAQLAAFIFIAIDASFEIAMMLGLALAPVTGILCWISTKLMTARFKFHVGPDGIACMNIWCKNQLARWDQIERVETFNFVGMHYLRIWATGDYWPIWLPLFIKQRTHFDNLVESYVGPNHDLVTKLKDD